MGLRAPKKRHRPGCHGVALDRQASHPCLSLISGCASFNIRRMMRSARQMCASLEGKLFIFMSAKIRTGITRAQTRAGMTKQLVYSLRFDINGPARRVWRPLEGLAGSLWYWRARAHSLLVGSAVC